MATASTGVALTHAGDETFRHEFRDARTRPKQMTGDEAPRPASCGCRDTRQLPC